MNRLERQGLEDEYKRLKFAKWERDGVRVSKRRRSARSGDDGVRASSARLLAAVMRRELSIMRASYWSGLGPDKLDP